MTPAYFHNDKSISAEAFYAIACDPRRSVAVEACAGAGKTWMLVSRMLRALLEGGDELGPQEILAITFTKKAAGEMRERLYEWLEKFAHANDETLRQELVLRGIASQKDPQSSPELRQKLANLYQRVLDSGRPVQIRTFHSWFAALLRSAPVASLQQMGLPVNYELLEDDSPARALVWRRFYAVLVKDAALKADFETVVMAHGRSQTDKALQGALDKRTEFLLADAAGVVDSSVQHFTHRSPVFAGFATPEESTATDQARKTWLARAAQLGAEKNKTPQKAAALVLEAFDSTDLSVRCDTLRKAFFVKDDDRLNTNLLKFPAAVEAESDLKVLCEARQQAEAWDYQQRMARLARLLLAEFTALKREKGWVDMNDVERAALVMLGDGVLSAWVQERLDARIKHLMIDEFQDTNPLQWQALYAWLSGYSGAGRAPSVFIVGDPKQSIYRFRRAEPQVFIAAQAFVRDGLGGDLLACDHTRRNSVAVISAVNRVMLEAQASDGYDSFRSHTSGSDAPGAVVRLPQIPRAQDDAATAAPPDGWRDSLNTPRELPEETLRSVEARQAAAWIAGQIASGLKASDVMVLSRKRAGLMPLQNELRALQIAGQIGEKTELIDCCEVLDIVALLDVLVSPQHDLSLARALRSPLFGLDDAALVQIALAQGNRKVSWFDLLQNSELLTPEIRAPGADLIKYKGWVDSLPPHDALQAIYHHRDVLARFAAAAPAQSRATVLANLRALLNVALQLDGGRYATPYAFVRALKAGGLQAPAAVNADAVRLLTIHGAKGLEAHSVLLLDTDTLERALESMSVLVDWPGEATAPQRFVFLVSETRPPACATESLALEQAARKREELNALYVALTRARTTLAVSSIEPHRATTSSWWQRLFPLASEVAAPTSSSDVAIAGAAGAENFCMPDLPVLPPGIQRERIDSAAMDELDSPQAKTGKAMHRLLEWGVPASWGVLRQQLMRELGIDAAQADHAHEVASRIRHGDADWAWDAATIDWQGNEVELVHAGNTFRLDRLVRRRDDGHQGHWWVLDYKLAHHPQLQPALVEKIQLYRAAMQAIYPGETVKAAFLAADGTVLLVD